MIDGMDRQDQVHAFALAAHRLAIDRLRENPARMAEAADVIERWRRQTGGPTHCEPCRVASFARRSRFSDRETGRMGAAPRPGS
ncbi:MAG: hypothetical protein V4540_16945 [Pseudomonadota bacterium]